MQLDEFIQQSLQQIIYAVATTQKEISKDGYEVNPQGLGYDGEGRPYRKQGVNHPDWASVQMVTFDVAVTASESTEKEGKAGISVIGVGGGMKSESAFTSSSVSRLQFQIPVVLPYQLPKAP